MKQRGRPLKFGRPAQLLALTLPRDVLIGLRRIHPDPAWAIVSLYEKLADKAHRPRREPRSSVELAQLSADSALIVVDPELIHSVPGVSVVPVAAGRAFLAFGEGRGLADLEVAVLDRLQKGKASPAVRKEPDRPASTDPGLAPIAAPALLHALDHHRRAREPQRGGDADHGPGLHEPVTPARVPGVPENAPTTGPAPLSRFLGRETLRPALLAGLPGPPRPTTRCRTCPA